MDLRAVFGVEPSYQLTEVEAAKYDSPYIFISLTACDWLNEEKVASKFVASGASKNKADIPTPIRKLSHYTRDTVNSLLEENYGIHGSLAGKTADGIIESLGASGYKKNYANDSDDICTSQNYHPKRSKKYSVTVNTFPNKSGNSFKNIFQEIRIFNVPYHASVPKDDSEGLPVDDGSETMSELKEFRYRSIELTKTNANQVSDLRLSLLDCIYLFSNDIKVSVSQYLETDWHNNLISNFINQGLLLESSEILFSP